MQFARTKRKKKLQNERTEKQYPPFKIHKKKNSFLPIAYKLTFNHRLSDTDDGRMIKYLDVN